MTNRKIDRTMPNTAGNTVKAPEDWTTGDEPMTGAQRSYLQALCEEAGEPMDETLTKAQASERIEALQQQTGRSSGRAGAGERRADEMPEPQRKEPSLMDVTAKDVLTPDVVRVTADMEVRAVARLFGNEAITGAPVVDGEGHVVGVISQSDLLAHTVTSPPKGSRPRPCKTS